MSALYHRIKKLLDSEGIKYKELYHKPVYTSQEAADIRGTNIEEGAKALIFDGSPPKAGCHHLQIVIQGNKRVDKEKFKNRFGFESLKMVSEQDVEKISGVKPGAVAPFGNLFEPPIQVYAEVGIMRTSEIEFNAGDHKISIRMKTGDWVKIVKPTFGKFAERQVKPIIGKFTEIPKATTKPVSTTVAPIAPSTHSPEYIHKRKEMSRFSAIITILAIFFAFLSGLLLGPKLKNPFYKEIKQQEQEILGESTETTLELPYKNPPPEVSAKAYGIFNLKNDTAMYTKNPDLSLSPASVTKIMTAIVAMEENNLERPVVIPERCAKLDGSKVGFLANEVLTLEDLLYGLLVRSGSDAACAIANIHNETEFIDKMNRKADELGMDNTVFENEIGFDSDKFQFSTVNDIEKLARFALKSGVFRKIVGSKEIVLTSLNNSQNTYKVKNTNNLLFTIPGTVGIKTGFTDDAGECLIYLYENNGQEIMVIIMGSADRFGDTVKLLDWAKTIL